METTIPIQSEHRTDTSWDTVFDFVGMHLAEDAQVSEPREHLFEWRKPDGRLVAQVAYVAHELRVGLDLNLLALFRTFVPSAFRTHCQTYATLLYVCQNGAQWTFERNASSCFCLKRGADETTVLAELVYRSVPSMVTKCFHAPMFRPRPVLYERENCQVVSTSGRPSYTLVVYTPRRSSAITDAAIHCPQFPWAVICPPEIADPTTAAQVIAAGINAGVLRDTYVALCVENRCIVHAGICAFVDKSIGNALTFVSSLTLCKVVELLRAREDANAASWNPPVVSSNQSIVDDHRVLAYLRERSDLCDSPVPECPALQWYRVRDGVLPPSFQFALRMDDCVVFAGALVDAYSIASYWLRSHAQPPM